MNELKSINEVCKQLGMTSRTIRYYEQLGLISTVRDSKTAPRKLDDANILKLRKIQFLRRLGLSLEEIAVIIDDDKKAKDMVYAKTEEFTAEIISLKERITLLQNVLDVAVNGGDIYSVELDLSCDEPAEEKLRIVNGCLQLLMQRRFGDVIALGNNEMRKMNPKMLEQSWDAGIKPCGKFLAVEEQTVNGNLVVSRLRYENSFVVLRIVISNGHIMGIAFMYEPLEGKGKEKG